MKVKIALATLFILFFNLLGPLPQIALADSLALAKLSEVKGEVSVRRGGGLQELAGYNGMGLFQGDSLRTGASGTVKITYGDGTETTVGAGTQLTMQRLSSAGSVSQSGRLRISASSSKKIGIFLWTGSIWNKVKSLLNADDQYEVETPTAIMGVRGTLYLVNVNQENGATTGAVLDGTVAIQQNRERTDSGREQLVVMGEELEVYSLDASLPKQTEINGDKLIETTEPTIIAALITDVLDRVSEMKEKAKAAQIDFGKNKDTVVLKNAIALAEKASKLTELIKGITEKAAASSKVEQIKDVLKEQNKTLEQVQIQVEQIRQEVEQTRAEVVDTAKDAGLSEEEIQDIVEEAAAPVTAEPAEAAPAIPESDSSDGGGGDSAPSENTHTFSLGLDREIQTGAINKDGTWAPVITIDSREYWIGLWDESGTWSLSLEGVKVNSDKKSVTVTVVGPLASSKYTARLCNGTNISQTEYESSVAAAYLYNVSETSVFEPVPYLNLSSPEVVESSLNDGSLDAQYNFVKIQLTGGAFAADMSTGVTANNLPAGLGIQVERSNDNNLLVQFTGNALSHAASDSISNASVTIAKEKISGAGADMTVGEFAITFKDEPGSLPEFALRLSSMKLVSVDSDGNQTTNYGHSKEETVSANGRYVAFSSYAANLVTGDTNGRNDVFVRDLTDGKTVRVSVATDGTQGNGASGEPSISADGRYVAFSSYANNLVAGDTNGVTDIFVRDRDTDGDGFYDEPGAVSTVRVNVATDGTQASGGTSNWGPGSSKPVISADGRYVKFESAAASLVPNDTNNMTDVFVQDLQTHTTERVSVSSAGVQSEDESWYASMSADGRFVAFTSGSDLLVPGVTDYGIFIRDRVTNTTKFLVQGGSAKLSGNGRFVAFEASDDVGLVQGDTNGYSDIFVMDRDSNGNGIFDEEWDVQSEKISKSSQGEQPNTYSNGPTISSDGRFVSYYSQADNLVPDDTNNENDIFLYDRKNKLISRISTSLTLTEGDEGSFEQAAPVVKDGKVLIAFTSDSSNLVEGDLNNETDIFLAAVDYDAVPDTEPPVVSEPPSVADLGPTWVKLTWSPATDNYVVTKYAIYRGLSANGPFFQIGLISADLIRYWDTTLAPGNDYYYYIQAKDGEGNWSAPLPAYKVHTPAEVTAVPEPIRLAAGNYHSAVVRNGNVWSWGENRYGELGDGTDTESVVPVPVRGQYGVGALDHVAAVSAGLYYTVALKEDGTVWAWGDNGEGQLGNGTTNDISYTPVPVVGPDGSGYLTDVISVKASEGYNGHTLALRSDGTVWAWGDNMYGQLGNGTDDYSKIPIPVKSPDGDGYLTDIIAIAAGPYYSMALRNDHTVWAWGANAAGQLGIGIEDDWDDHTLPVQVKNSDGSGYLTGIQAIAAGGTDQEYEGVSMAIDESGGLWSWGYNHDGELGNGSTSNRYLPGKVIDPFTDQQMVGVIKVGIGGNHAVAVKDTIMNNESVTTVWAWGYNWAGQLGNGYTYDSIVPAEVKGVQNIEGTLTGITEIAAGYDHSLALMDDGSIAAWGANYSGQLGYDAGSDEQSELPGYVGGGLNWIPVVWNVNIIGKAVPGQTVTGDYDFLDADGDTDISLYQWYMSDTRDGTYNTVAGAVYQPFDVTENLLGKYLKFEVTPINSTGSQSTAVSSKFLLVSAADDPAPVLQTPTVYSSSYSAQISVTMNETGTIYWSVLPASAAAPDAASIKRGIGALSHGGEDYSLTDSNLFIYASYLSSGQSYVLYVFAEDDARNSTEIMKIPFTTSSNIGS